MQEQQVVLIQSSHVLHQCPLGRKEKTTPVGVIQGKLRVNPSSPLAKANIKKGGGGMSTGYTPILMLT